MEVPDDVPDLLYLVDGTLRVKDWSSLHESFVIIQHWFDYREPFTGTGTVIIRKKIGYFRFLLSYPNTGTVPIKERPGVKRMDLSFSHLRIIRDSRKGRGFQTHRY